jgi:hypothetical protein
LSIDSLFFDCAQRDVSALGDFAPQKHLFYLFEFVFELFLQNIQLTIVQYLWLDILDVEFAIASDNIGYDFGPINWAPFQFL